MAFGMLYPSLSHYLQARVHVSDPMGGHDGDSTVGPGNFSSTRCYLFCSLFVFFRVFACLLLLFVSLNFSLSFVCLCVCFLLRFILFILFLCFFIFHFSIFQCIGVAGV